MAKLLKTTTLISELLRINKGEPMLEQMKSVSNPLTIIALFAALAEIAGTVAIKLVTPELQPTFIWFVMLFPTLIVVLFFVTLNFNAKVLYAPADFRNEENYLAVVNAKQSLGIEKLRPC